jgi:predicted lipoprotein with Yx(FWY)xxD motif
MPSLSLRPLALVALAAGALVPVASAATSSHATVAAAKSAYGRILVDSRGRTLYLFEKDRSTASTCYGACATYWPPLLTKGKPVAVRGAVAGKLGTTKRKDGTLQVTYKGHPLYLYAGDGKAGQTLGQNLDQFGAEWYVLSTAGVKVEKRVS